MVNRYDWGLPGSWRLDFLHVFALNIGKILMKLGCLISQWDIGHFMSPYVLWMQTWQGSRNVFHWACMGFFLCQTAGWSMFTYLKWCYSSSTDNWANSTINLNTKEFLKVFLFLTEMSVYPMSLTKTLIECIKITRTFLSKQQNRALVSVLQKTHSISTL